MAKEKAKKNKQLAQNMWNNTKGAMSIDTAPYLPYIIIYYFSTLAGLLPTSA